MREKGRNLFLNIWLRTNQLRVIKSRRKEVTQWEPQHHLISARNVRKRARRTGAIVRQGFPGGTLPAHNLAAVEPEQVEFDSGGCLAAFIFILTSFRM